MGKKIILLNGASSSGKSTLARNLKKIIRDKKKGEYGIISIDDFLEMNIEENIYEDDVYDISLNLCQKAIEELNLKDGIIIDHVITSERIYNQLIENLKLYDIYSINVTCPLDELEKRECKRKNRCLGSARESYKYLFPKEGYYLSVDTYLFSIQECALKIINSII